MKAKLEYRCFMWNTEIFTVYISTALKVVKEIDYTKDYKEWAIVLTYK